MEKFKFSLYDKIDNCFVKISSLNFDESGLVQVSFVTAHGKLVHSSISKMALTITSDRIEHLNYCAKKLEDGRHFLMGVDPGKLTAEDALEAFGFGKNGLKNNFKPENDEEA